MEVDFLQSTHGIALTKQFRKTDEGIEVQPYPLVRSVISHHEDVHTPEDLYQKITHHAKQGHCMLKGQLARPLQGESRAGQTDSMQVTQWVLLDLDFDDGWESVDAFLYELNPAWRNVSYVWQYSSSAGIRHDAGLRGHIWIMLDEPTSPSLLKSWLKERNLTVPRLRERIELTATGFSVRWPLDVTTCQNDKLIYIAPPIFENGTDPIEGERIQLVRKDTDFAPAPTPQGSMQQLENSTEHLINELRKAQGLPKRTARYKEQGAQKVLANPDEAVVTGEHHARGFVYLNLNGGDSWGYFFPEDKPELLFNFKDEPVVRLKDIAPEFYYQYRRRRTREAYGNVRPYVLRDPQTDTYYNVIHDRNEDQIKLLAPVAAKDRLRDFMEQYGYTLPDPVPDWTIDFDPTTTEVIDPEAQWLNRYQPTDLIRYGGQLTPYPELPPIINRVVRSVCADDDDVVEHMLNWLACLLQTRKHLGTAWVLHGVEGTGKGVLFNQILRPILGQRHAVELTMTTFEEKFNDILQEACLLWLDEFRLFSSQRADMVRQKLWNLITEPSIEIRAMHKNTIVRPNYVNVMIASNFPDPLPITEGDRRFNIAPAQDRKLYLTRAEVEEGLPDELPLFVSYLMHREADLDRAAEVIDNEPRQEMQRVTQTAPDAFFSALKNGDLDYFIDYAQDETASQDQPVAFEQYCKIVWLWVDRFLHNYDEDGNVIAPAMRVSTGEALRAFQFITDLRWGKDRFGRRLNQHCKVSRARVSGYDKPVRAFDVDFQTEDMDVVREFHRARSQPNLRLVKNDTGE